MQGVERVCGPGEEPLPGARPLAPRGGDQLVLAARVPPGLEAAWEALHHALHLGTGGARGPTPPRTHPRVDTPGHPLHGPHTWSSRACAGARLTLPSLSHSTVHHVSRCLRMCTSLVGRCASITSQPTSWMGQITGWNLEGAGMRKTWCMYSTVGPSPGVSCAAWARGGEGRSSKRREADAVAYMAASRKCSVSPSTTRWLLPSRSRGMVASAFRVRSAMARWGSGLACVGSSGGRPSDGAWGGHSRKGDGPTARCSTRMEWCCVWAVRRGQGVRVRVPRYRTEAYAPPVGRGGQGLLQGTRARLCAPGDAVCALGRYGMRYRVYAESSYRALYVVGDDGAEDDRAVRLSPWYTQSVSSSAILRRSFQASRFMVLLLVVSVTLPAPVLVRGSRLFWCCAAARLRAAWRAVLLAVGGAWWADLLHGVGVTCSGCFHSRRGWCCGGWRPE